MYIEFTYGPRTSIREHVSREVGAALTAGGFAIEVGAPPIDPIDLSREMPHPAGWTIERFGANLKVVLVRHDGTGGKLIFDDVPTTRRWKYDPATGDEGYVEEPCDCPSELISEFRAMKNRTEGSIFPSQEKLQWEEHLQRLQNRLNSEDVVRARYARGR